VTVRFSDSGAMPDGSGDANPHGMAIKFHLPDGYDTDMVIVSLKFGHRRGLPGSAARDCRHPAECAQAEQIRAVRGEPPERAGGVWHRRHAANPDP
jgi:hypothetical protein